MHLNSSQTKCLFEGLQHLYKLSAFGVSLGEREFVVDYAERVIQVPEDRKDLIQKLLSENYGEEIWAELIANDPDLATRLSLAKLQQNRLIALKEFEENIDDDSLPETYWQKFFSNNKWIFGYGLSYVFLSELKEQPNYGGAYYTSKGNQKGDFLLNSNASVKYTVLVELKKPSTKLLLHNQSNVPYQYRPKIYIASHELSGGVAQIQANCKMWENSSLDYVNRKLENNDIFTVQPKGIIVVGRLSQLQSDEEKKSFELYRRNIYNPQIITFDELLERAKFIVQNEEFGFEETKRITDINEEDYSF